jgi:hypothetical protein
LSLRDLVRVVPSGRAGQLTRAVVLSDDLHQREAALAGELEAPTPAVLTSSQARGQAPLPKELETPSGRPEASTIPADVIWRGYYVHAMAVATRLRSRFLQDWVGYQVAVRNALAVQRARALGLDRGRYRVARRFDRPGAEVDMAVDLWSAAEDPLQGTRALIGAHWRWIEHAEPRYTFHDDEFAAYAAKLVLLHRWHRIEQGPDGRTTRETPEAA